jgi:carbamoyl-phosphate synthase large subunit
MKATGEVMAIDRTFETALMKAVRGLEVKQKDLRHAGMARLSTEDLEFELKYPSDERLWALAEGIRRGWSFDDIYRLSRVDYWFLTKIKNLVDVESELRKARADASPRMSLENAKSAVEKAFLFGFPSVSIKEIFGLERGVVQKVHAFLNDPSDNNFEMFSGCFFKSPRDLDMAKEWAEHLMSIQELVDSMKTQPVFKMVDTCAGEFESKTPYYYSTFESENDFIAIR